MYRVWTPGAGVQETVSVYQEAPLQLRVAKAGASGLSRLKEMRPFPAARHVRLWPPSINSTLRSSRMPFSGFAASFEGVPTAAVMWPGSSAWRKLMPMVAAAVAALWTLYGSRFRMGLTPLWVGMHSRMSPVVSSTSISSIYMLLKPPCAPRCGSRRPVRW